MAELKKESAALRPEEQRALAAFATLTLPTPAAAAQAATDAPRKPIPKKTISNPCIYQFSIGIAFADVTHTLLSHSHIDHIGGLASDGKILFPNAAVVIPNGRKGYQWVSSSHRWDF